MAFRSIRLPGWVRLGPNGSSAAGQVRAKADISAGFGGTPKCSPNSETARAASIWFFAVFRGLQPNSEMTAELRNGFRSSRRRTTLLQAGFSQFSAGLSRTPKRPPNSETDFGVRPSELRNEKTSFWQFSAEFRRFGLHKVSRRTPIIFSPACRDT